MERRRFSHEFKIEAAKPMRERGVAAAQATRDLNVHENVLRKWVREFVTDPQQAFPGQGRSPRAPGRIGGLRTLFDIPEQTGPRNRH